MVLDLGGAMMNALRKEFDDMVKFFKEGISKGYIKMSANMNDFDYAVYFATAKITERKGAPCDVTPTEIYQEIMKFAPELMEG